MKQVMKSSLDCILYTHQNIHYILPIVAFAELGVQAKIKYEQEGDILGRVTWRGLTLPLLAHERGAQIVEHKSTRIAILNTLSSTPHSLAFFAILIDNNPQKLKVRASELEWVNKEKRIVRYSREGILPKELVILDLEKLSRIAQSEISPISP